MAPIASEVSVTPSCIAAMKCGGSLVIFITERAGRLPLVGELLQPRPAHGDERVLGRDEEAVQQDQSGHGQKLEENRHAPVSGAAVLEGSSPTTARQYRRRRRRPRRAPRRDARPGRRGRAARDGRASRRRRTCGAAGRRSSPKSGIRHLVAGAGLGPERGRGLAQALVVVGDQLARSPDGVDDRVTVAAVGDLGRERDRPLEGVEVVAERVGPARRPEADGRRDPREQVVGGDQDTVPEQRQLAVGMARGGHELPAVEAVAVVDELGIRDRPQEGAEQQPLPDQLLGDRFGDAVQVEPVREDVRPAVVLPDELGLLRVDPPLADPGARSARGRPRPPRGGRGGSA